MVQASVTRVVGTTFDYTAGVVVIGAGAAGLVAALAAQEAGADVLVLERDSVPRGSTALSAGLIPAAATRWQKEASIVDSPALFERDILTKAHHEPDAAIIAHLSTEIGPILEWLADHHGLDFSVVSDFSYPGHSARRMHGLPTRSGEELIDALRGAAERAEVPIICDARVYALHVDDHDKIVGLSFLRPDGTSETIGCEALVLACNGYGGNKELVSQHITPLADALYFGHPGNQGDALLWGHELKAQMRDLNGHQGHGSVAHPAGILISWATMSEGGFQVNLSGARFSNEALGYSEQAAKVLAQEQGLAWSVFDGRIASVAAQFEDFRRADHLGIILRAESIEALAEMMKVSASSLKQTFDDVATFVQGTRRDPFGRDFQTCKPLQAPYCAVKVTGALFHTQGGLVVDRNARVIGSNGMPLANLYAAGGAACGVSGNHASGYLSGNGLLTAIGLGATAGRSAADLISK